MPKFKETDHQISLYSTLGQFLKENCPAINTQSLLSRMKPRILYVELAQIDSDMQTSGSAFVFMDF